MASVANRLYSNLVEDEEEHGCRELPESACREVPGNAGRLVAGFTLQKLGDRIVDPKTVIAWMLTSLGAPGFIVAMLVPIREAGALLPQAGLIPLVRRFAYRKRAWAIGGAMQGVAVVGIGLAGATFSDLAVGVAVLLALAVFSLARAISSISSKDLIGKTIPRGNRGSVTGIAAAVAGTAAIGAGVLLAVTATGADPVVLSIVVIGASLLWFGAAAVFLTVDEEPSSGEPSDPGATIFESLALLRDDVAFRHFIATRSLMLVTALSPPLIVALSAGVSDAGVSGVGPFVIATGIASLVSSPIWGRLADHSSRLVMATACGAAGVILSTYLLLRQAGLDTTIWLGPATYLLLAIVHAGARMGRKTYVVDLGRGEARTRYVAVSNTVIGMLLLLVGVSTAAVSGLGTQWLLAGFAVAGLAGAGVAVGMREIHQ